MFDNAATGDENRCVLRLRTTTWGGSTGLHIKRSLTFLRRQCTGYNVLEEDASAVGVRQVIGNITNLAECEDGVYEAVVCDTHYDYETGYVDEWNYKLVPFLSGEVKP